MCSPTYEFSKKPSLPGGKMRGRITFLNIAEGVERQANLQN